MLEILVTFSTLVLILLISFMGVPKFSLLLLIILFIVSLNSELIKLAKSSTKRESFENPVFPPELLSGKPQLREKLNTPADKLMEEMGVGNKEDASLSGILHAGIYNELGECSENNPEACCNCINGICFPRLGAQIPNGLKCKLILTPNES